MRVNPARIGPRSQKSASRIALFFACRESSGRYRGNDVPPRRRRARP
jgi:hypothetical protein